MSHMPKRSSVMGNRKTGDLSQRQVAGNQSQAAGGRYDVNEEAKAATPAAIAKAQQIKQNVTLTKRPADPIAVDPEKNDITNQVSQQNN